MLDFGPPKEVLALAMDPPNLENISATIMHLKEIGALLPTVSGTNLEVRINC
jgi:ATP-dependent RNA helicase TDRD9